jgi:hypothetical protein
VILSPPRFQNKFRIESLQLYHIQVITSQMVEHQSQEVFLEDNLIEKDLITDEDEVDKGLTVVVDAEVKVEKGLLVAQELVTVETWI